MHEVRAVHDLLNQIKHGEILLPEFQRGYVWNRDQVRGLMQSLYRKHPTGHLLIWRTYKPAAVRDGAKPPDGHSLLLLDGQQRLTTLYVLFKGEAPRFYEGESLFFDLYFNVQTEEFRFWQKSRMENNPAWIGVHEFLNEGLDALLERLDKLDVDVREVIQDNLSRLSRLNQIGGYTYTVDQVSGEDVGVDEVVEIFNRVNSAGTPLTSADLALAHVCSIWPEAREEMRAFQTQMAAAGFDMEFSFLVRCLAGVATGSVVVEGSFTRTPADALKVAWRQIRPAFEHLVSVLRHEAFIGNVNDLPSHNVLIPATIYLARRGGCFPTDTIKRRFIRWINIAALWARYSGAAFTKLQQDVSGIDEQTVRRLISGGENETVEFKSSLRWDILKGEVNKALEKVIVKTLAGFLNGRGGTLLIGVEDAGTVIGIAADYDTLRKKDRDGFELHFRELVARDLGESASAFLTVTFHEIDGKDICQVTIEPSDHEIYTEDRNVAVFYLRTGNATRPLPVDEAVKYIPHRWGRT